MKTASELAQLESKRILVEATMEAVVEHGFSKLTLAKIAARAGMTAASVNFHFKNKDALLLATLQTVADEYQQVLEHAIEQASDDPLDRLFAVCEATLDKRVTTQNKMAVWYAFSLESRTRDDYEVICGARDQFYYETIECCCDELVARSDYPDRDAHAIGYALAGLIDHLWQDFLMGAGDPVQAKATVRNFIEATFPSEFGIQSKVVTKESLSFALASEMAGKGGFCCDLNAEPIWLVADSSPVFAKCSMTGLKLAKVGSRQDVKCPLHGVQCIEPASIELTAVGDLIVLGSSEFDPGLLENISGWERVYQSEVDQVLLAHDVQLLDNAGLQYRQFDTGVMAVHDGSAALISYIESSKGKQVRQLFHTRHLTKKLQRVVAASNQLSQCN